MQESNTTVPPATPLGPSQVGTAQSQDVAYYAVSPNKLAALSVATLNCYAIYWLYRQWKAVRDAGERPLDISPFGRALFGVFFIHELFTRIRVSSQSAGLNPTEDLKQQATVWIVLVMIGNALSRAKGSVALLGMFVAMGAVVPLLAAQKEINAYLRKRNPAADLNGRFSAGNILVLVLGGLLILAAIAGSQIEGQ